MKFVGNWMEVEKTILSKVMQIPKNKHGIYLEVDMNCKIKDTYATFHKEREPT